MSNIQTGLEKEPKKSLSKLQCSKVNIEIPFTVKSFKVWQLFIKWQIRIHNKMLSENFNSLLSGTPYDTQ